MPRVDLPNKIAVVKREVLEAERPQNVRSIVSRIGNARVFEIESKGHLIRHRHGFATVGFDPSEFDGTDTLES